MIHMTPSDMGTTGSVIAVKYHPYPIIGISVACT